METCSGCIHFTALKDGKGRDQSVCTRNPPTAFLVMVQGMAGPEPSVISAYPIVPGTMPACGEYLTPGDMDAANEGLVEH